MDELTGEQLDLLQTADRGAPLHTDDHAAYRDLEAAGLVRRTGVSWFATDAGGRALVAAGRKAMHLAVQPWGRGAYQPPGGDG